LFERSASTRQTLGQDFPQLQVKAYCRANPLVVLQNCSGITIESESTQFFAQGLLNFGHSVNLDTEIDYRSSLVVQLCHQEYAIKMCNQETEVGVIPKERASTTLHPFKRQSSMTSISTLAVAAPMVHTEVNPNSQLVSTPLSAANYLGGGAIAVILAVMIVSGLSAAGLIQFRHSNKAASHKASHKAPRTVH
jgi:hypothetical protein